MRDKLAPLAKQFFKINSDLKQIFITEDRHAWYEENEAIRFCKGQKKYEKFTKEDFMPKPKAKQPLKKAAPKKEE